MTSYALRHGAGGVSDEAVTRFPEYVDDVLAMMDADGVGLSRAGPGLPAAGDPRGRPRCPTLWLLGSSDYSARLAAEKGLPYVFAHHFSGGHRRGARAVPLELPALAGAPRAPHVPHRQRRRGRPRRRRPSGSRCPSCWRCWPCAPASRSRPQLLVEEAEKVEVPEAHRALLDAMRERG